MMAIIIPRLRGGSEVFLENKQEQSDRQGSAQKAFRGAEVTEKRVQGQRAPHQGQF